MVHQRVNVQGREEPLHKTVHTRDGGWRVQCPQHKDLQVTNISYSEDRMQRCPIVG